MAELVGGRIIGDGAIKGEILPIIKEQLVAGHYAK